MLSFWIIRFLERKLSVRNLHRVLAPVGWIKAWVKTTFKRQRSVESLPEFFQVAASNRAIQRQRTNDYLNQILDYFPDQLAGPRWAGRCRINGLERLQHFQRDGRPVVLAFVHFGPVWLIRTWLRTAGIAAAIVRARNIKKREAFRRHADKFMPCPEIPAAFCLDQIRPAAAFLAKGNTLCIAMDVPNSKGKIVEVPFGPGWSFRMTTGAVRLAIREQAELMPVTLIDEGGWRFRLEIGRPVPKELLTAGADWSLVGKHLIDEMMPHFKAHPECCGRNLMLSLKKSIA